MRGFRFEVQTWDSEKFAHKFCFSLSGLIQEFSRCTYHIHDMDDINHLILTTVLKWQDLSDHKSRMCDQESSCNNSFVMGNQI
jgi:hypothetical protein